MMYNHSDAYRRTVVDFTEWPIRASTQGPLRATRTYGATQTTDSAGIAWRRGSDTYVSDVGYAITPSPVCGWDLWFFVGTQGRMGLFIHRGATVTSCMRAAEIHRVHWTMGTEYD